MHVVFPLLPRPPSQLRRACCLRREHQERWRLIWWLVRAYSRFAQQRTVPWQHSASSFVLSATHLARPARYHAQVREEWSAPAPGRMCNATSTAGESCGVPPRRSRWAARPHPRRPQYRVHHVWTAPPIFIHTSTEVQRNTDEASIATNPV